MGSTVRLIPADFRFELLTGLVPFPKNCHVTAFLEMSELGLYQACRTTIWPLTTSISLLGISTARVSPGRTKERAKNILGNFLNLIYSNKLFQKYIRNCIFKIFLLSQRAQVDTQSIVNKKQYRNKTSSEQLGSKASLTVNRESLIVLAVSAVGGSHWSTKWFIEIICSTKKHKKPISSLI